MKTFLAMLMVLIVSGDDKVVINGSIEDRVILPCPCPNRNLAEVLAWQMEEPNKEKVLVHHGNHSNYSDKYKNRAQLFQNGDKYNCSLLLTNITADDQGKYRCSFTHENMYNALFVHLNVSANFNLCQKTTNQVNDSLNRTECEVEGRYRDTEILWYLDQQLLTNSTTTKIIHNYTSKAAGSHTFTSEIITELTGKPICKVKAKGVPAVISELCPPEPWVRQPDNEMSCYRAYFKLIPIALVIGVSLVLLYRWKHSQGLRRHRQVKTNPFLP
ncbi:uncharacterized protein si:dkey-192g7.3 isoform X2 [Betta splendens]|uniref:Uncharacterized protein si:dkey-192g7.3 isoform X2 n=1 Tax=Betta splendens TaxID=158456 RepID=A0A6P7LDR7_BETSP|nr:uncharacterized protein si:dkey-192g7.3 isoform X2 [Betta splendens]